MGAIKQKLLELECEGLHSVEEAHQVLNDYLQGKPIPQWATIALPQAMDSYDDMQCEDVYPDDNYGQMYDDGEDYYEERLAEDGC